MFRNILIVVFVILALFIATVSVYLTPDDLRQCSNKPQGQTNCQVADAIVTISGGNTSARTSEAIRLYKAGWSDTLIFSGAAADTSGPSNAEVMRRQAIEAGVPTEDIIIETDSQTTKQNAERTKDLLVTAGGATVNRVILVTSPYHQRRASLEFSALAGDGIAIVNHPTSDDPDWSKIWWVTPRGWWLIGGELAKIAAFYAGESR